MLVGQREGHWEDGIAGTRYTNLQILLDQGVDQPTDVATLQIHLFQGP